VAAGVAVGVGVGVGVALRITVGVVVGVGVGVGVGVLPIMIRTTASLKGLSQRFFFASLNGYDLPPRQLRIVKRVMSPGTPTATPTPISMR
jgi:hypothetical protein